MHCHLIQPLFKKSARVLKNKIKNQRPVSTLNLSCTVFIMQAEGGIAGSAPLTYTTTAQARESACFLCGNLLFLSSFLCIWSNSISIFIITFLKAKGIYILEAWEGNKLKFSHCVLCCTDWLGIAYEGSIVVLLGLLMCNLNML